MIRFARGDFLPLLALLPVMAALIWGAAHLRRRALSRFGAITLLRRLSDAATGGKRLFRASLVVAAAGLLVLGLANPQVGTRMEEVKQEGVDLMIALDVSLSMKAEDLKPSRLEKAKLEIRNLIGRLRGDRIGLIVFAGDAYIQFPLTTDYGATNLFLDAVDTDAVPLPGTNIAGAIERALDAFTPDGEDEGGKRATPVLVIITDGEDTEGETLVAAEKAAGEGVLLYTIGMGSPTGAPIPVYGSSGRQVDFKRDRSGNVVISKLDEITLEKISNIGRGLYFRGTTGQDELEEISKSIGALQKREYGVKQFTDYEDRFQWFLLPGVVLLLAELLLAERRTEWIARWNPFRRAEEAT